MVAWYDHLVPVVSLWHADQRRGIEKLQTHVGRAIHEPPRTDNRHPARLQLAGAAFTEHGACHALNDQGIDTEILTASAVQHRTWQAHLPSNRNLNLNLNVNLGLVFTAWGVTGVTGRS